MSTLFKLLGVLLACYVALALFKGEIYAKSGIWGRTVHRDQERFSYWSTVAVYVLLSVALLLMF